MFCLKQKHAPQPITVRLTPATLQVNVNLTWGICDTFHDWIFTWLCIGPSGHAPNHTSESAKQIHVALTAGNVA